MHDVSIAHAIGDRIRVLRNAKDLSQVALASIAGLHRRSLEDYESGRSVPGAEALIALARSLGCTSDELLGLG